MTEYYFVGASLPKLEVGQVPDITLDEFEILCKENLYEKDREKLRIFRRLYDMQNILAFWKGEEPDPKGNFNENALEDAFLTGEGLPDYVYDFLDKYETTDERIKNFSGLMAAFFKNELKNSTGFLHELLKFERDWRLVFAGLRAKEQNRDLLREFQFEDPDDELVAQIIAQKDAKHFEPPEGYADLKAIFEEYKDSPIKFHQALCEYRFRKIEELYGIEMFSIDRLLGYFVRLIIVEQWFKPDKKKGLEIVDTIVKEAS